MSVVPFPADRIVRDIPVDSTAPRHYACQCGSQVWRLETSGAVVCAQCKSEVALVVRPFQAPA